MKLQTLFNKVAKHLMTQREPCKSCDLCLYRDQSNGLKCAIGCLVPDSVYEDDMEERSIREFFPGHPGSLNAPKSVVKFFNKLLPTDIHRALALALQECHDEDQPEDWHQELRRIAGLYELNADILNKFKPIEV